MAIIGKDHSCRGFAVAGVVLAILATASAVTGQEITYTGSLQFSTGDYIFTERTSSFYLFSGLAVSAGPLGVSAIIPVIMQSTPWVSNGGTGMIPLGGTQHSEVGQRKRGRKVALPDTIESEDVGLGDPLLRADVELLKAGKILPSVHIAAQLKAPLADVDQGFGTGEWDYGGGVSLTKAVGGNFVFVDVSYWVLGDLPDLELQDPVAYGVTLGRPLAGGKLAVLASFLGYTEIIEDADPPAQVGFALTYRLASGRSLSASMVFGLTESSPDFSVSLGWRIGL